MSLYTDEVKKRANSSPYYHLLGMEVIDLKDGWARIDMNFKNGLTQFYGAVHGGAIASLLDSSVAIALLSLCEPGDRVTTIEMKINYLHPVNEPIRGEGKIIHKGSRIAVGEADAKTTEGKLVAKALVTYMIKKNPLESLP